MKSARRLAISRLARLVGLGGVMLNPAAHADQKPTIAADQAPDNWYPVVRPGRILAFPADHGAHPKFRTEWWYLTAWLDTTDGPLGFQLTFFRSRTRHNADNPSRFAPRQLMFAHAALAAPANDKLIHAQLAARANATMFAQNDTALHMVSQHGDWLLERHRQDHYRAVAVARRFRIELNVKPDHPPVAQGDRGYSRKGPREAQASYYYSRPHLNVTGTVELDGRAIDVDSGTGWLDHEWASELLDERAVGWDWLGLNLSNGDALMVFNIRTASGTSLYSHARWIRKGQPQPAPAPDLAILRTWRSQRTNTQYPVSMSVRVGTWHCRLQPLIDDQELDTSRSTGTVYWEGAVRAIDPDTNLEIGRGYLELTGYAGKVRF